MINVLAVLCVAVSALVGVYFWALLTTPKEDLARLKLAYEGLQGRAGPHVKVTAIEKVGVTWIRRRPWSRDEGPYRKYLVHLIFPTGEAREREVFIEIISLGGRRIIDPKATVCSSASHHPSASLV